MIITPKVGAAMSTAVVRANDKSYQQLADELADALQQIDSLRAQLREAQRAVWDATTAHVVGEIPRFAPDGWVGETYAGRPVVRLGTAAKHLGSYSAAYRRVAGPRPSWDAVQLPSGDWLVFVDAGGVPLPRGSRS